MPTGGSSTSRSPIRPTSRRRCSSSRHSRASRASRSPVIFSSRLPPRVDVNAISAAIAALHERHVPLTDLTASNPPTVGLPYPRALLQLLGVGRGLVYEPRPFGLPLAREAAAHDYARRGARVDAGAVVLSASTSESYSWLFKLLCSPGDAVLAPRPSYPLFE